MRVLVVVVVVFSLGLFGCSPTPPAAMQNQTTQQTPTPKKDNSIHVSEKGW